MTASLLPFFKPLSTMIQHTTNCAPGLAVGHWQLSGLWLAWVVVSCLSLVLVASKDSPIHELYAWCLTLANFLTADIACWISALVWHCLTSVARLFAGALLLHPKCPALFALLSRLSFLSPIHVAFLCSALPFPVKSGMGSLWHYT